MNLTSAHLHISYFTNRRGLHLTLSSQPRSLRSKPKSSLTEQSYEHFRHVSNFEPTETYQPAKRLKLTTEGTEEQNVDMSSNVPTDTKVINRENSLPTQDKEPQENKRRTWTLPKTKRASSLNLHNHPGIHHPVAIAIWVLQKIDQARSSTDGERSEPTSSAASPSASYSNWEINGPRVGMVDTSTTFTGKPASLTGAAPVWGLPTPTEHEDDTVRREAQRQRKTKQRTENWAKSKPSCLVVVLLIFTDDLDR